MIKKQRKHKRFMRSNRFKNRGDYYSAGQGSGNTKSMYDKLKTKGWNDKDIRNYLGAISEKNVYKAAMVSELAELPNPERKMLDTMQGMDFVTKELGKQPMHILIEGQGYWSDGIYHKLSLDQIGNIFNEQSKINFESAIAKKATPANEMMIIIKNYLKKLKTQFDASAYVVEKDNENTIEIRTDGLMYDLIYNPSMSEMPYLMKEAAEEFNVKLPVYDAYQYQNKLFAMVESHGWNPELAGGGVIKIIKESD
jgi:hypothetical protein